MVEIRFPFATSQASLLLRDYLTSADQQNLRGEISACIEKLFNDFNQRLINSTVYHFNNSPVGTTVTANDALWEFLVFCQHAHNISNGRIAIFPEANSAPLSDFLDYNYSEQTLTKLAPVTFVATAMLAPFVMMQLELLVKEVLPTSDFALVNPEMSISQGKWELEFHHPHTDGAFYVNTVGTAALCVAGLSKLQNFSFPPSEQGMLTAGVIVAATDLATAAIVAKIAATAQHRIELLQVNKDFAATLQLLLTDGSITNL